MRRCSRHLRFCTDIVDSIQEMSFYLSWRASTETTTWARFGAVLFPEKLTQHARKFWYSTGDGMSSRHAQFCLVMFPFMDSVSSNSSMQRIMNSSKIRMLPSEPWEQSDLWTKGKIKALIARLATSWKPSQQVFKLRDIFLYPKEMCAIGSVARSLVPTSTHSSEAVIFG